jgi:hypothetical protein
LFVCAVGGAPTEGTPGTGVQAPAVAWPIHTRDHVDLWLHGYGMLTADTTRVPYFRRGYKQEMQQVKSRANVSTQLDANMQTLEARMRVSPALVNAQFLAMYFGSWDQMRQAIDIFLRAEGDPRRATDEQTQAIIATLAGYFRVPQDRDWLRVFTAALHDERERYYNNWWTGQRNERAAVIAEVEALWRANHPRFQRFLNGTSQASGDMILSMPLNGEGRTITPTVGTVATRRALIAVTFPTTVADAANALHVFTHEAALAIAGPVVSDNITPAEQRAGAGERLTSYAAVRGGAMVLQQIAPDLADGYARYYLRAANLAVPSGSPQAALAAGFPLPNHIRDALTRQIEIVLGGI